MTIVSGFQQEFQKKISENTSRLSSLFMELSSDLKASGEDKQIQIKLDKIFKLLMESNQSVTTELNKLISELNKVEKSLNVTLEEKRKLEILFSSGIMFTSETEMKSLMDIAIETVLKELGADAGFIILTNEQGEPENIFAKNMDPNSSPDAIEMSTTVIKNTINNSAPVHINNVAENNELSAKESVIRLGISAVLCVPLISSKKILGAVYLDRRNKENPFQQNDLLYLLSFAKQIIRGLEISLEITTLEKKLLTDAILNFEDLRKEFDCENIIGSGKKLFEVLKIASKISPTDASVIILGENGTGKDLLAKAIHNNSRRSSKPFVTIDCGSIPADLLESELFGYESGAFTGATKSKPGKLEIADGGTLFFDEIGEMNVNLQAKLLRVLQTREIERLGSVQTKKIDVRILCATNKVLSELVSNGLFREDLYYRLKVIELTMPPLRSRKEDIAELITFFIEKHTAGKQFTISNEALETLEDYNWPGNVRELENVILRCVVLSKNDEIDISDLPPEIINQKGDSPTIKTGKTLAEAETEFRKAYIIRTLRQVNSKSEAAQLLGINRTHFYKLLSQLDLDT